MTEACRCQLDAPTVATVDVYASAILLTEPSRCVGTLYSFDPIAPLRYGTMHVVGSTAYSAIRVPRGSRWIEHATAGRLLDAPGFPPLDSRSVEVHARLKIGGFRFLAEDSPAPRGRLA